MTHDVPIRGQPATTQGIAQGAASRGGDAKADGSAGVAFRALLDELATKAQALEQRSQSVEAASQLAGAVQGARDSLSDALSLHQRMLEAYREALQQSRAPHDDPRKP